MLLLVLFALPNTGLASSPRSPSLCSFPRTEDTVACFPPASVARVERRLRAAVDPRQAVRRFTNLHLTQIELDSNGAGFGRGPFGLEYLFGHLPANFEGLPEEDGTRPPYIMVGEGISTGGYFRPILDGGEPEIGTPGFRMPWEFDGTFPGRRLSLGLTTNISATVARRVGYYLLKAPSKGK